MLIPLSVFAQEATPSASVEQTVEPSPSPTAEVTPSLSHEPEWAN